VLHSWNFDKKNISLSSLTTYITHALCDILPCRTVYDNIIYTDTLITDFVNVGIKMLNTETEENTSVRTADLAE